ncbi:MAG TPA: efflux RND transporter periplasmic adaptor subunit [Syntrophomonadaceae bacterium]|nr:efflux RND transporter periplasmic adaptor subunit [Syntrophomonadaceae bacterium]
MDGKGLEQHGREGADGSIGAPAGGTGSALMRKRLLAAGLVVILLVAVGIGLRIARREKPAGQSETGPVPVEVMAVERGEVKRVVDITGRVAPEVEVNIIPKVPGRIRSITVDVGDRVREGQVLAKIDDAELVAALHNAEAGLAVAEANARIAAAALEDARRNLDRMKQLYDAGAVSQQQLEQAQLNYDRAAAGVAEAQVRQARAAVEAARVQLANTVLTSPVDGVVTARFADPGAMAGTTQPIMTVAAIDQVQVQVSVTGDDINRLKAGQEVPVQVSAAGDQDFKGKIARISPAADARSKMYPVEITIPNPGHLLKPGMFAEVKLATEIRRDAVRVPVQAVLDKEGRKVVYVVEGGRARERRVETGIADERYVEIISGLRHGERVVITGQEFLADGAAVTVTGGAGKGAKS